jgi:hypothetical protein
MSFNVESYDKNEIFKDKFCVGQINENDKRHTELQIRKTLKMRFSVILKINVYPVHQ